MKTRKILPKKIPARDVKRAFRFYRDVFDFPQDGDGVDRFLTIDGKKIEFYQSDSIEIIDILARDYQDEVASHLTNYFIDYEIVEDKKNESKIRFLFEDSEGNKVSLQVNR